MSNRNEIYHELVALSPLLADHPRVNPYRVPDYYFDNLASRLTDLVSLENVASGTKLPTGLKAPYQVPEGYFDHFISNLMARIDEAAERSSIPAGVNTPYAPPVNYFDGLADEVMKRIKALEVTTHQEELEYLSPLLRNLNKPTPFVLPDGYFNDFAGDLLDGVHAVDFVNAELEEHSPLMASVRATNVYEVPQGYFESLAGKISQQVARPKRGGLLVRALGSKLVQYAAAALVAGVIAFGGWVYVNGSADSSIASTGNTMEKISNEEMINYLETAPTSELANSDSYELKADDVQDLLADVSDQELTNYLDQNASSKDLNN